MEDSSTTLLGELSFKNIAIVGLVTVALKVFSNRKGDTYMF